MKKEQFDLVHCHMPLTGVLARMAAKKTKTATVIYTGQRWSIDEIQLRGTYTGSKRNMEVTTPFDTTLGGAFVEIGNDREDMFINGVDEMQNKAFVRDRGNYGVSYTLKIPTKGNEPFRLYFSPLGGPYSV